jgi:hypothetical protein
MTKHVCKTCGEPTRRDSKTGFCGSCYKSQRTALLKDQLATAATPIQKLQADRDRVKSATALAEVNLKYRQAVQEIERLEYELAVLADLNQKVETYAIEPLSKGSGTNEGTAVLVASDWHCEEQVLKGQVSGLNEYNLEIAKARATKFFQAGLRLIRLLAAEINIPTIVLPLLGDFITGQIHGAENAEANLLLPNYALVFAQGLLISGIEFLLANTDPSVKLVVPCHSGNHARTTHTTRFTSENGHSLEYLMYGHLKTHFRHEPRITFLVAEGMHSYMDIYGTTIRFHHGHAVKYNGGVGGLYIPVGKAIHNWNDAKHADLDVFGHFHTLRDGGSFICNGSLIGYNTYALSIKAAFEKPRQALFLMDKKRGRTCTWPVFVG